MDPEATLEEIRAIIEGFHHALETDDEIPRDEVNSLVKHFHALDGWISRGGFLPRSWRRS
jgi:DNA-binding GntR family transcriptional regulator